MTLTFQSAYLIWLGHLHEKLSYRGDRKLQHITLDKADYAVGKVGFFCKESGRVNLQFTHDQSESSLEI